MYVCAEKELISVTFLESRSSIFISSLLKDVMPCRVVTEGCRFYIIVAKAIFVFTTARMLHEYVSCLSVDAVVYYSFKLPINQLCFQQMKQSCANYSKRFQAVTVGHIRIWCYWLSCGVKWLNFTACFGTTYGCQNNGLCKWCG